MLITVAEVVYNKLPYLLVNDSNNTMIAKTQELVLLELKNKFNKVGDYKDEGNYAEEERLLVGCYTAFKIVHNEAMRRLANANSEEGQGATKREKVDVLEVEYFENTEKNSFTLSLATLRDNLRLETCQLARRNEPVIGLDICKDLYKISAFPLPFKVMS